MKIGVIQASTQAGKNAFLFETVKKHAADSEIINFGCGAEEKEQYSYIEISLLAGLLLVSGTVDFIVTGCSSGQGMMLACNSFPGVLCGYAPTPMDAYLFAQINNGNAVSLPLGEGYTWAGYENCEQTIKSLFSEPFGQGYPKADAHRKQKDAALLKEIRAQSQTGLSEFLKRLDTQLVKKILTKRDVIDCILSNSSNACVREWITSIS